jgi:cation:H+ antiporter
MAEAALLLLVGLVILLTAGEFLVRGASGLASIAKIPPLIIGLTVVAFGTSAPELVVTVDAVTSDAAGIALGNIVGSNIANVLLVLGLPAILLPISMSVPKMRRHGIALLLATVLFCGMVYWNGQVGALEAYVFTAGMVAYFVLMWREARNGNGDASLEIEGEAVTAPKLPLVLLFTALGLIGLPLGATLLVNNGEAIATMMGVRQEIIGLTIVAFGTSLPELATVLAAVFKKDADVSAGTIIGSNIFNMLFVGAAAGYAGTSAFTETALRVDLPVMIGATALIVGLILSRKSFGRILGLLSVAAYVAYIVIIGAGAV